MATGKKCKGFACGNLIAENSMPADRIENDSLRELLKEIITQFSEEKWFKDIVKGIITESFDEDWFKKLIKEMFQSLVNEQWFKDLICSLGCGGAQPIFNVSPKELIFDAEGGEKNFSVSTNSTTSWQVSC